MKRFVRALVGLTVAIAPLASWAQAWQINKAHSLLWGGEPYLPIGVRIPGDPDRIKQAAQAGIHDVVVELPANGAGWKETFDALELTGMHYLIAITSMPPMAPGIAVEPQSYRVNDLLEPYNLNLTLDDSVSIYAVLVSQRDLTVSWAKKIDALSGKVAYKVVPPNDLGNTLLLYPEFTGRDLPDYWDAFDEYRDQLLIAFHKNPPGKGLRGILNPMGQLTSLEAGETNFVPTSSLFRYELKAALEEKYRSLQTAIKVWNIAASDIESWEELARLIPLWSGNRGIAELYDPTSGKIYLSDSKHSSAWADIQDTITHAEKQRQSKLVDALRQAVGVPILQEWRGWSTLYEGPTAAVDGVGMRTTGSSFSEIAESGSPAASSSLRSLRPSWLTATDVEYPNADLSTTLQDLEDMGVRGCFFRTSGPNQDRLVAALRPTPAHLADDAPLPLYYPESAYNPAAPQRLPGGYWWLPSPAAGNRVELGGGFSCYRYDDGAKPFFEIWKEGTPGRVKLRLAEPKKAVVKSLAGEDLQVRVRKDGIELNMGAEPIMISGIDEIPVPELAYKEVVAELLGIFDTTERTMLGAGSEYNRYSETSQSFDRSPGGAFTQLMAQLREMRLHFAPYVWQEAESTRKTNFSESQTISGCSGGSALVLHAVMPNTTYYAEYDLPRRSRQAQEVWVAARIPKGEERNWTIDLGGQVLHLTGPGVSGYGVGFAWYRAGVTKLGSSSTHVRVSVEAAQGTEEAIDALVLFPGTFHPHGQSMPQISTTLVSTAGGS